MLYFNYGNRGSLWAISNPFICRTVPRVGYTNAERAAITEQLERMLASPLFSHSRRYPNLLRHIVERTLDGRADELKERTIGVEVFGREPGYDTNADPRSAGNRRRKFANVSRSITTKSPARTKCGLISCRARTRRNSVSRSKSPPHRHPLPSRNSMLQTGRSLDSARGLSM